MTTIAELRRLYEAALQIGPLEVRPSDFPGFDPAARDAMAAAVNALPALLDAAEALHQCGGWHGDTGGGCWSDQRQDLVRRSCNQPDNRAPSICAFGTRS